MFNVQIKGVDTAVKGVKDFEAVVKKYTAAELNIFGVSTVKDAKTNAPADEGVLRNSISATVARPEDLQVTISVNVDYAAFLEFGTRGFAASYVATLPADWQSFASQYRGSRGGTFEDFVRVLTDWVHRKGFGGGNDKQAAYLIARSIMIKGIRPHPYLIPAVEKNKIELIKRLKDLL